MEQNEEFEFKIKMTKENKKYSEYLEKYNKCTLKEKEKSRTKNKEFWNDFFNESKLEEDIVSRKYPNPKNFLQPNQLPQPDQKCMDQ